MLNRFQKLLYYLSVGSPILIVFAIVLFIRKETLVLPILLVVLALILIVLFQASFNYAIKKLPNMPVKTLEISCDDGWLVMYLISYLFPLVSLPFSDNFVIITMVILSVGLIIVLTFTDYVSPHPILFMFGYHFYKLNVEGAQNNLRLISKQRLRKASDVKTVRRMFELLLIKS